jgi:hypothetical protein
MKWITRSRVHVDRVACPWLISRFVDSTAEFLFVPASVVAERAEIEGATPFDIPGAELGHHEGRCSFVAIIKKYDLKDPALLALAEVIDAADTGRMDQNPYAPGLEAIAQGFSLTCPDDQMNLDYQFVVYDALYAFFKLQAAKSQPVK